MWLQSEVKTSKYERLRLTVRQRLGPTKKRLVERIQEAQNFLQQDTKQDEIEDKANQLLLEFERNLNSYKDLLVQLQEASKEDEVKRQ